MRALVFIPPKDFTDETLGMVTLFFDKWNVHYDIAAYGKQDECRGSHGAVHRRTIDMAHASPHDYDAIVLCDGTGMESFKFYEYRPLLDAVLIISNRGGSVIAVGNAAKVLARANIIKQRKIAVPDDDTKRLVLLFHGIPTSNDLEISDNVMTMKDAHAIERSMMRVLQKMNVA